jgi:hypothetical protein
LVFLQCSSYPHHAAIYTLKILRPHYETAQTCSPLPAIVACSTAAEAASHYKRTGHFGYHRARQQVQLHLQLRLSRKQRTIPRSSLFVFVPLCLRLSSCLLGSSALRQSSCTGVVMIPSSGDRWLVEYPGHPTRHERLILAESVNGRFYILTPDGDMYLEAL